MRPNLMKAIAGGLAGTVLMTLMMYFVAPMMLGHPMDIAEMLGKMMGNSWGLGMLAHLINGIIVFPLIYIFFVYERTKGAPVARGMIWGIILWLVAELVVMPMAGAGFFSADIRGMKAIMAALIGHVVYGGTLGAIAGESESPELKLEPKHTS